MRRLWDRIRLWWAKRRRKREPHDDGGDRYRVPPSEAEFMRELLIKHENELVKVQKKQWAEAKRLSKRREP